MADLTTLRNDVRLLGDIDATDVTDGELDKYINDAYSDLIGNDLWPFLLTRATFPTVANQSDYTISSIASDIEHDRVVYVMSEGVYLEKVEPTHYFKLEPFGQSPTSAGQTLQFWTTLESSVLVLWPAPSSVQTVQVVYLKLPAALDGGNPTPVFPTRYHWILKWGALRYVYQKIGDLESAETAQEHFKTGVTSMAEDLLRSTPRSLLVWGVKENIDRPARLRFPWE